MDESRAAARKALADATHRRSDEVAALLRQSEGAPQPDADGNELDGLVRRAQSGDLQAREELIERMPPLVNSVARAYRTARLEARPLSSWSVTTP
jgi:DNA-directed RNA polymerase sigma subunit (sigma70/sigma32)